MDLEILVRLRKFFVFSWYEPNQDLKQDFPVKNCEEWGGKKTLWMRHDLKTETL